MEFLDVFYPVRSSRLQFRNREGLRLEINLKMLGSLELSCGCKNAIPCYIVHCFSMACLTIYWRRRAMLFIFGALFSIKALALMSRLKNLNA